MKRLLFLLFVLICSVSYGQTYQSMPQAGYGPVKRMLFDSVVTLPMGITSLRNISGGRDTAQIRYNKNDSSIYVYTGSQWVKSSGGSTIDTTSLSNRINQKVNISDTANKWISAVSKPNDSSLSFTKGTTVTTYSISTVTSAKRLATLVYNSTGTTIAKGSVVYINGRHSSNLPTIALAQANDEANSYKTFAIVAEDIATSSSGTVIQAGNITGLNLPTSSYTDGDILYLSPTIAGGYTTTKPLAPYHICKLGSVTRAHPTQGSIEIKIENGWQLDELSDVQIPSVPNDSALLQFSRTDSLWHSVSTNTILNGRMEAKQDTSTSWKTGGNFNVNAGQFIGSRNNASLRFRTNNTERLVIDSASGKAKFSDSIYLTNKPLYVETINNSNATIFQAKCPTCSFDAAKLSVGTTTALSLNQNGSAIGAETFRFVADYTDTIWTGLYRPLIIDVAEGLKIRANRLSTNDTAISFLPSSFGNLFNYAGYFKSSKDFILNASLGMGIGTPAASSLVDMTSTTKGLLIPRMTTTQRDAISSPASQLLVSNTTKKTLDQYNGTSWNSIAGDYNKDLLGLQALGSPVKSSPIGTSFMPSTGGGMTAARSYFNAIIVDKEITITGAMWYQSTQGVYIGTGGNYNGIALYSQSGGTLTLIDSTARDTTIWKASSASWNQKTFAGGSRTLQPGVYYLLALANTKDATFTTAPVLGILSSVNPANSMTTNSAKLYGGINNNVSVPPTTQAMSAWNNFSFYYALYLY